MSDTNKLWSKGTATNDFVEHYTTTTDIGLDQLLIPYDIYGSLAHSAVLRQAGIITRLEEMQMRQALGSILNTYLSGSYKLNYGDEDVHTRIENDLTKTLPLLGGKLHSGRSRNDQVLLDIRLYTKDQLQKIAISVTELTLEFQNFALQHEWIPMVGYTHMQPAMLSSVGLWSNQFAESLYNDLQILKSAYELNDQSPLGSGAAYGSALPLNRLKSTQLLGFKRTQINSLFCQNSRGKIEASVMHAFSQIMLTLERFASDLLLYTMSEMKYFSLPVALTTGSSIMPQKRNLDIMELLRARAKTIIANEFLVMQIISGLTSGYNRDVQEMKKPFFESFKIVMQSLTICKLVLQSLTVHPDALKQQISKELFATHYTSELVLKAGIPFRTAYKQVGADLDSIPDYDIVSVLKATSTLGSPGNLQLAKLTQLTETQKAFWNHEQQKFKLVIKKLCQV